MQPMGKGSSEVSTVAVTVQQSGNSKNSAHNAVSVMPYFFFLFFLFLIFFETGFKSIKMFELENQIKFSFICYSFGEVSYSTALTDCAADVATVWELPSP